MKGEHGFTLVELLVVIAIIGVLAAIIAPNAFNAIEKAKITRAIGDLHTLKTSTLQYYSDVGIWPPDVGPGIDPGFMHPYPWDPSTGVEDPNLVWPGQGLPSDWTDIVDEKWDGPYIEKWPYRNPWGVDRGYDYDNWTTVGPSAYRGSISVTIENLPSSVHERILRLANEGKFPYRIIETPPTGRNLSALILENAE